MIMDDSKLQPEAYDDYVLDEQIGYVLRMANQRHAGIFQSLIRRDLTPTQFSVLIRLSEKGELSQNFLGRLVAIDTATTKGCLRSLYSVPYRSKDLLVIENAYDPVDYDDGFEHWTSRLCAKTGLQGWTS